MDGPGSNQPVDQQGSGSVEPSPDTCVLVPHAVSISQALMMVIDHNHAILPPRPNLATIFVTFNCGTWALCYTLVWPAPDEHACEP